MLPNDRGDLEKQKFIERGDGHVAIAMDTEGSSSSSAGGNSILVGVAEGTSYIFDASAQTVTFSGLGTLKIGQIQSITNLEDNVKIYDPSVSSTGGSLSGNVLTLTYDTTGMSDTDELQVYVYYVNSEDYTFGAQRELVQNPEWAHRTSPEHIIDEANVAAATYRVEFSGDGYRGLSGQLKGSGGVTFTLWATNDSTATTSSDAGWLDVSLDYLKAASWVDKEDGFVVDTSTMWSRWMIKYVTSDSSNAIDAWILRY